MSLQDQIFQDFKEAFKAGDTERKETLSLVKSAIHNKEIEKGKKEEGLSDEEVLEVLSTEAKKRKDAIEGYDNAGRQEQADKERAELAIIDAYLPSQMSTEEVRAELETAITETDAQGKQDIFSSKKDKRNLSKTWDINTTIYHLIHLRRWGLRHIPLFRMPLNHTQYRKPLKGERGR